MSLRPIARSPDLTRLRNEGYDLDIRGGFLLVRDVPYVGADRTVRRGTLSPLLRRALDGRQAVTDEAGALEALGCRPLLVRADATNFKVTYPADLELAELVLKARNS